MPHGQTQKFYKADRSPYKKVRSSGEQKEINKLSDEEDEIAEQISQLKLEQLQQLMEDKHISMEELADIIENR